MVRVFRDLPDIEALNDDEMIRRYRINHHALNELVEQFDHVLGPRTRRNRSLPSKHKILITLRYLATGVIQLNTGDLHQVAQSTVSRVITQTIDALSSPAVVNRYIRFQTDDQSLQARKQAFYQIARFPNVIGVLDGTHVQIQAPSQDEPMYVNRMGYHSINTQVVFDHEERIIDIVARWPGCTHDSRILRASGLWQVMENRRGLPAGDHHILGDSGYPCKRWLMTPYLRPRNQTQEFFNRSHKATRSKVERGIGQLKRRWAILHGETRLKPEKTCKIILACAVLHNICKTYNLPMLDMVPDNVNDHQQPVEQQQHEDGLRYRDVVCQTYFGN